MGFQAPASAWFSPVTVAILAKYEWMEAPSVSVRMYASTLLSSLQFCFTNKQINIPFKKKKPTQVPMFQLGVCGSDTTLDPDSSLLAMQILESCSDASKTWASATRLETWFVLQALGT